MYRFIESIKVEDGRMFLADLHQKRISDTLRNFGGGNTINLASVFRALEHDEDGLFKFRMVYGLAGVLKTQMIPYAIPEIEHFQLVENNSFDYAYKFEDRKTLEAMKDRAKAEEIIIVKNNHITDTSFSNLLFKKGRDWYTPATYLLNGVMRQHLLKSKKIKEAEITVQNLNQYSHFQIINSLNDFDDVFIYPLEKIINLPSSDSLDD